MARERFGGDRSRWFSAILTATAPALSPMGPPVRQVRLLGDQFQSLCVGGVDRLQAGVLQGHARVVENRAGQGNV